MEELSLKHTLRFNNDGKFRVLFLTDIHGGRNYSPQLPGAIRAMVEHCRPDIVLLGGDTAGIHSVRVENEEDLRSILDAVSAPMEEMKIPWAHVFGNHDDNYGFLREQQEAVYESYPYCVSKRGSEKIHGVGNYVLPVLSHDGKRISFNIWMLDSNDDAKQFIRDMHLPDDTKVVLPIHFSCGHNYTMPYFDQVMWYYTTSQKLEEYNGGRIPAMMVMHEAVPEMYLAYMNPEECSLEGNARETPGCGEMNTGLFAACLQRGDVKTMCFGHDHICDFSAVYCGIRLAYGGGLSYDGYCDDDIRGGRMFEIDENDPDNMKTYLVRLRDIMGEKADKTVPSLNDKRD